MKYTKKDLASYNLHLINTDKFKTITMKVVFSSPIKKDEITMRNVLSDLLLQSSNLEKTISEILSFLLHPVIQININNK